MKEIKGLFRLGAIALALSLMVLTGCPTDSDDGGDEDVYKLEWGVCNVSYEEVYEVIENEEWTYTKIGGTDAAFGTKSDATSAYNYCVDNALFEDTGTEEGSFDEILNTQIEGISAPKALKTKLSDEKGNVPVGGIFAADEFAVMFYITKK